MPFTPFHFGAGLALRSVTGEWFSFLLFCFVQVIIDLERDAKFIPSVILGERVLFVAAGSVDAYVDFTGLSGDAVTVSADRKAATVRLPHASLAKTNIDHSRSYVFASQQGILDRLQRLLGASGDTQQQLYVLAEKKIGEAARRAHLIERAEQKNIKQDPNKPAVMRAEVSGVRDWYVITGESRRDEGSPYRPFRAAGRVTDANMMRLQQSKLFDEHLAFAYQESFGFPVTVLRFFGSYGPRHHRSWWGGPQAVFIDAVLNDRDPGAGVLAVQRTAALDLDDHFRPPLRQQPEPMPPREKGQGHRWMSTSTYDSIDAGLTPRADRGSDSHPDISWPAPTRPVTFANTILAPMSLSNGSKPGASAFISAT